MPPLPLQRLPGLAKAKSVQRAYCQELENYEPKGKACER
jgi:hypothetical protein